MSISRKKIFFENLDTLRFLAFVLVFLQHGFFPAFKDFLGKSITVDRVINSLFISGGTGVQIFFVLSGFLISYLIITEIWQTGKLDVWKFYLRRTLRIWPLYYATVIFAFVIYPYLKSLLGINSDLCSRPFYYFTFLANFDNIYIADNCPGRDAMTQGIVWSVSIEEQFYLVWPLLFTLFKRRWQIFIFPLVIILSFIFRLNATGATLYFHTFAVMGDLALGGLFAYWVIKWKNFRHLIEKLSETTILLLYFFIGLIYFFSDKIASITGVGHLWRYISDVFWVFIIITQCFSKNLPVALGRFKKMNSLGKVSYGLYMLHPIGILIVDIVFRITHIDSSDFLIIVVKGVIAFVLSIFIAKVSYKYLELPFLKLKDKFAVIRTKVA